MSFYRTGTIALTNGSASIVGTGTDFIVGANVGECISAPDGKLYEILSIQSSTALTLGTVYLGSTASGQAYSIVPTQSYIRDLASQAAALVNSYSNSTATQTHAATTKATPVDADEISLVDSTAPTVLRKLTWANLKATLAAWINGGTIPGAFTTLSTNSVVTSLGANDLVVESRTAGAGVLFLQGANTIIRQGSSGSYAQQATFSTAGLAVTGALSATGKLSTSAAATTSPTATKVSDWTNPLYMGALLNNGDSNIFSFSSAGVVSSCIAGLREATGWNTALAFYTNNLIGGANPVDSIQEKMRLDSSGNLLIGQQSLGSGGLSNSYSVAISSTNAGGYITINHQNGAVSGFIYSNFGYNGAAIGSITQNGTTAVAYNTTSDYRLKTNIRPANALRFMDIEFHDFEWTDGRHDCGPIAHELQAIYPDLVTGTKDGTEVREVEITAAVPAVLDIDGVEVTPAIPAITEEQTFPVYQQVNYMGLIGRMGTVIQQQQKLIQSMEARISAIELK
jgi:hypothetical protein